MSLYQGRRLHSHCCSLTCLKHLLRRTWTEQVVVCPSVFACSHSKEGFLRLYLGRDQLTSDGTRPETRFRLSAKWTSPFKSAGASVQSTTGSRVVRISGSNAGYTMFRGSVKSTGYPHHSPVSPSLPLPCVTVCHHVVSVGFGILLWFLYFLRSCLTTKNVQACISSKSYTFIQSGDIL